MKRKILVVTATLGNRETLSRTVASVRSVGGELVKHVIIAPAAAITDLKNKYHDLAFIPEPEKSKGIYGALNHAFKSFGQDYKYLTFINDDDYWLPDYRILIDTIINDDKLDFVYAKTQFVNDANKVIGEQSCGRNFTHFIPLLHSNIVMLTQQATIIKSDYFFKIGGFDETYKLVADTKFWCLLSLQNIRYKFFNKCCAAYTIQDGQLSSDHTTQGIEHKRLLTQLPHCSRFIKYYAMLLYRLENTPLYVKRMLNKGGGTEVPGITNLKKS